MRGLMLVLLFCTCIFCSPAPTRHPQTVKASVVRENIRFKSMHSIGFPVVIIKITFALLSLLVPVTHYKVANAFVLFTEFVTVQKVLKFPCMYNTY